MNSSGLLFRSLLGVLQCCCTSLEGGQARQSGMLGVGIEGLVRGLDSITALQNYRKRALQSISPSSPTEIADVIESIEPYAELSAPLD